MLLKKIINKKNNGGNNMNKISNYIWGLVLVLLGVIIGLNTMGITSINLFFDGWWTLFIIVPCFINLFVLKMRFYRLTLLAIHIIMTNV